MKYKKKVLPSLTGIENRISLLINVIDGNKPMAREEVLKILKESQKHLEKNIELIELEPDDADRNGPNLV